MIVTAAVVLLIVVGTWAASTKWLGTDDAATPAGPSAADNARQVAAGFLQAYSSYDADRAMGYLTDEAITPDWGSPEGFRGDLAWNEAVGWTELGARASSLASRARPSTCVAPTACTPSVPSSWGAASRRRLLGPAGA